MATIDTANFTGVQFVTTNDNVVSQMILSFSNAFVPNAVHFDANSTGDYFVTDPSNVANSKQMTFSLWVKPYAADAVDNVTNIFDRGFYGQGIEAYFKWSDSLIFVDCGSGDTAFEMTSNNQVVNAFTKEWHHILVSIDANAGIGQLYIDDQDAKASMSPANVVIDMSGTFTFGAGPGNPTGQANSDRAEFWFNPTFIDLDVEANRRKFISSDLKPVSLGANGELVTGSLPAFYLGGNSSSYENGGYGGAITAALSNNALEDVTPP